MQLSFQRNYCEKWYFSPRLWYWKIISRGGEVMQILVTSLSYAILSIGFTNMQKLKNMQSFWRLSGGFYFFFVLTGHLYLELSIIVPSFMHVVFRRKRNNLKETFLNVEVCNNYVKIEYLNFGHHLLIVLQSTVEKQYVTRIIDVIYDNWIQMCHKIFWKRVQANIDLLLSPL